MQEPICQLNEIIWEVCNTCHNNCSYCGSKEHNMKTLPSELTVKYIVESIAEYPPKELNISGGDPLLLDIELHNYITSKLKDAGCSVKIIVNPKSLKDIKHDLNHVNTHKVLLYDVIGLSINTREELNIASDIIKLISKIDNNNVTVITNFNNNNIWIFSDIEKFVRKYGLAWQVQYTMYNGQSDDAIYQNADSHEYLKQRISDAVQRKTLIVTADNMNTLPCTAGRYSCGITANGDVIPCLSMRSWNDDIKNIALGNIFDRKLKDIWSVGFAKFRCNPFKCCKDICKLTTQRLSPEIPLYEKAITLVQPQEPVIKINQPNLIETVYVYGVTDPSRIAMMYGVFKQDNIWGLTSDVELK